MKADKEEYKRIMSALEHNGTVIIYLGQVNNDEKIQPILLIKDPKDVMLQATAIEIEDEI